MTLVIKWVDECGRSQKTDIQTIIVGKGSTYNIETFSTVETKIEDLALFCAGVVEMLFAKKIVSKKDVVKLIEGFDHFESFDYAERELIFEENTNT